MRTEHTTATATLIRKIEWGVEEEEQLTTENEEIENKKCCVHDNVQSTLKMRAMPQKHLSEMSVCVLLEGLHCAHLCCTGEERFSDGRLGRWCDRSTLHCSCCRGWGHVGHPWPWSHVRWHS